MDEIPITHIEGNISGIKTHYLPINLDSLYNKIHLAISELPFTSEQFKSNWWRIVNEKNIDKENIGNIYAYKLTTNYNDVCFQLPISLELIIE